MMINPDLISPCGLYCGVCAIYIAHRDNNHKFKERLVNVYRGKVNSKGNLTDSENLSIEDIQCRGCLSDELFMHCRQCEIRDCSKENGYTGCYECDEFPCQHIENFPMTVGKRLFYGLFRIGERSVLKSGFKMKKPAIFALNAAIKFSVVR